MKKITLLTLLVAPVLAFAQVKSTGTVNLSSNVKAKLDLDSATSTVTLTLSGPNDRWFAMQFGSFSGGMEAGSDLVYWNNVTLVDARHNGVGVTPSTDATNNWTVVSNTNNLPVAGQRTIVATRAFSTGDSNDYTFNFNDANIDLAWARSASASYSLAYHQGSNRGVFTNQAVTLGTEEFSLRASTVYPNPAKGWFSVKTNTAIERINVYSQTGAFVRSIDVKASGATEVRVDGLSSGIYLLELVNANDKAWKKLIVE